MIVCSPVNCQFLNCSCLAVSTYQKSHIYAFAQWLRKQKLSTDHASSVAAYTPSLMKWLSYAPKFSIETKKFAGIL